MIKAQKQGGFSYLMIESLAWSTGDCQLLLSGCCIHYRVMLVKLYVYQCSKQWSARNDTFMQDVFKKGQLFSRNHVIGNCFSRDQMFIMRVATCSIVIPSCKA